MRGDSAFFDSNDLLYLLSDDANRSNAVETLLSSGGVISTQVLNEFASVARRKNKLDWPGIKVALAEIRGVCRVVPLDLELHDTGLGIAERYGFSLYDSMIVAAAVTAGCDILYSEDLQDGQIIGHTRVSNPF